MASQILLQARNFEASRRISPGDRPLFHLSPKTGWMNDPNGFSYYKGLYHLFSQYHPYDSHWGPMHWGHAVSADLLRWTFLPCAMAPDAAYDQCGCFSGGAAALPDGRQLLMYTGVGEGGVQTQCLAVGDGTEYDKYAANPVIDASMLPEGASRIDFRDPHIWQEADGSFWAVISNLTGSGASERAKFFLFSSPDGFRWKYERVLAENTFGLGRMWECPDLFELDGQQVLLASATEMQPEDPNEPKGNGNIALIGRIDPGTGSFVTERTQLIDRGFDFYAAQTLLSPDGRRIMIAWMQSWDTLTPESRERPWFGQMTVPRELFLRDGNLCQMPVRELLACRREEVRRKNVILEDAEILFPGISGRILDLELTLDMEQSQNLSLFELVFVKNERYRTFLRFDPAESTLELDRTESGSAPEIKNKCRGRVAVPDGRLRLRVILDRFSVEVFANEGETALTMTLFSDPCADHISFAARGKALFDVTKYSLEI